MIQARVISICCVAVAMVTAGVACAGPPQVLPSADESQASSIAITPTDQGQVTLASQAIGELSGITHLDGDQYLVVSDKNGRIAKATIQIDLATGRITHAELAEPTTLAGHRDLEDISYDPSDDTLLVVDESNSTVTRYPIDGGEALAAFSLARQFIMPRPNLGLESLAAAPDGSTLWTANEEPLHRDGPRATRDVQGLIRLQRLDRQLKPIEQFAYRVDPHRGSDNLIDRAQSGVTAMLALSSHRLIVMERELGGTLIPSFRIRLYLVDTSAATRTHAIDAFHNRVVEPADKTLLYEFNAGLANFEGITLGPKLDNNDRSLVLVADDGGGQNNPQCVMTLRLSGLPPTDPQ